MFSIELVVNMIVRLRPSAELVATVSSSPANGRFEVYATASTAVPDLAKIVASLTGLSGIIKLTQPDLGDFITELPLDTDPLVLQYHHVPRGIDASTQTFGRNVRKRGKLDTRETYPPSGISRFKYLSLRRM